MRGAPRLAVPFALALVLPACAPQPPVPRIGAPTGAGRSAVAAAPAAAWRDQVHQGLVGLGWPARDAEKAIEAVAPEAGEMPDVAALLRAALRTLSKA